MTAMFFNLMFLDNLRSKKLVPSGGQWIPTAHNDAGEAFHGPRVPLDDDPQAKIVVKIK